MSTLADKFVILDYWKVELRCIGLGSGANQKDGRYSFQGHGTTTIVENETGEGRWIFEASNEVNKGGARQGGPQINPQSTAPTAPDLPLSSMMEASHSTVPSSDRLLPNPEFVISLSSRLLRAISTPSTAEPPLRSNAIAALQALQLGSSC